MYSPSTVFHPTSLPIAVQSLCPTSSNPLEWLSTCNSTSPQDITLKAMAKQNVLTKLWSNTFASTAITSKITGLNSFPLQNLPTIMPLVLPLMSPLSLLTRDITLALQSIQNAILHQL